MSDYTSEFTALMATTPIKFYSGRQSFVNDVISRCPLAGMFLRGRDISEIVKPGPKVKDRIFLKGSQRFAPYYPGRSWSVANTQPGVNHERPWAFVGTYLAWTEQEILMNNPAGMTESARMSLYKDVKAAKEQEVLTDLVEGMDDHLLGVPDASIMESSTVGEGEDREIMSLFAYVNEEPNGLWANSTDADKRFSTIGGLDPTNSDYVDREGNSNWQPKKLQYDNADLGDAVNGLTARMEEMLLELEYKIPTGTPIPTGSKEMLGSNTSFNRYAILTHLAGVKAYRQSMHALGDQLVRRSDPSFRTQEGYSFFGIPLDWSPKIDGLAIFNPNSNGASGSAAVTYDSAGNAGPRFWFLDTEHLKLFFHKDKMLEKRQPREPGESVEFWWQPIVCWWSLFARSLRRQGILYPGA